MRLGCQWLQALEIAFRQLVIDQVFIFALFFVDAMPISTIGRRPRGHDHSAGEVTAYGVRREKAALSSGCEAHPAKSLQPESNRSRHGGDEMSEAFG